MKVVRQPTATLSREGWIADFLQRWDVVETPTEEPTGYRDMGAVVRFSFRSGYVLEWEWQGVTPETAVEQAQEVGAGVARQSCSKAGE